MSTGRFYSFYFLSVSTLSRHFQQHYVILAISLQPWSNVLQIVKITLLATFKAFFFFGTLRSVYIKYDATKWHEHAQYLHHFLHHSCSVYQMCGANVRNMNILSSKQLQI